MVFTKFSPDQVERDVLCLDLHETRPERQDLTFAATDLKLGCTKRAVLYTPSCVSARKCVTLQAKIIPHILTQNQNYYA